MADLLLAVDTADTVLEAGLADNTQTDAGHLPPLLALAAGMASSPKQAQRTFAAAAAVANTEVASAVPVPEVLAASS
jgi:hypothetical protein